MGCGWVGSNTEYRIPNDNRLDGCSLCWCVLGEGGGGGGGALLNTDYRMTTYWTGAGCVCLEEGGGRLKTEYRIPNDNIIGCCHLCVSVCGEGGVGLNTEYRIPNDNILNGCHVGRGVHVPNTE